MLIFLSAPGGILPSDIKEQKKQEEALRKSEAIKSSILEASLDCLITMDHEGKIREFNPAAERTFGYRREEVLGREMSEIIIPPRLRENHRQGLVRYLTTGEERILNRRIELSGFHKNGTEFPVELAVTQFHHDGLPMFSGCLRDISNQKRKEEELRKAIAARDEFLSIASHELKTPLSSLGLQLQITRRSLQPESNLDRAFANCLKQVKSLTILVDEFLDISRIQTGNLTLHLTATDLIAVIQEVMERFAESIAATRSILKIETEKEVVGIWDPHRLEQILVNLISNCLKYAPGKTITVSAKRDNDHALLTVYDNGPGIAKEEQEKIFQRFERGAASKNVSGLGLGLYVVKQIAEAHGGSVHLESAPGQGAKFTVRLPLKAGGQHAPPNQ